MANYLTAKLPGIGGSIKTCPDDFLVEELPLYPTCGEGEHLYLEVEKRGMTTFELLKRLSRALQVNERAMGYAGLKDAQATTRQFISVTDCSAEQALALQLQDIRILSARRHRNKLRLGHLAGNRFTITIRDIDSDALEKARDILHVLQMTGVPNFFGEQRYGALGNSHLIGQAIVQKNFSQAAAHIIGDPDKIIHPEWRQGAILYAENRLEEAEQALPRRMRNERNLVRSLRQGRSAEKAVRRLPGKLLRLYLSAYQSHLFDRLVSMRLESLETLWTGDIAYKHDNGACFLVTDAALEQPRADRFEISPTAPLFGHKVMMAEAQAGILEQALLAKEGITPDDFRLGAGLSMPGERRPLRIPISETASNQQGNELELSFSLPKGSFATTVLHEVMKTDV
ncbi:tRNA pseudouridine 13 synthase [Syntrophotalea carbinolica DSM 2380]|uniref:tRNA pseudouridine synthase D n=1 Tax=Syntrophotalea carbinolica (strain DSM 2380 / NBRC 103641 / GraBd1) TaxID=338963 RepID=TRUD_SYNC1|nr:tRNA pseudouridine(13) synthase TruD [Syntrophotalea carbinolica]Q3A6I8.1 RecName: Full=tRNA pseudouridine synthase D; AltName: Full=tRNA pseudouridine(13) synthase; AltName: Full=tRNA pseudouridylate synthase D; AltName: Full=tRNA-uridine isomerase D [Syntrophotalea carbinolica DSM 2380]ABA88019.1 tRNA pseudouridine 13 synthase [Syntrophotalea carbinolica DSM 2380]